MSAEFKVKVTSDTTGAQAGINNVQKSLNSLKTTASSLGGIMKSAMLPLAALGGAAATGLLAGGKSLVDFGSKLQDLSDVTDISVDKLTVLGEAFERAGLTAEDIEPIFVKMSRALENPSSGVLEWLGKLNISMKDLSGLEMDEKFKKIGSAIGGLSSQQAKISATTAIFGKSSVGLVRLFKDTDVFVNAERQMGRLGDKMKILAPILEPLGDAIGGLKNKFHEFFATLALNHTKELVNLTKWIDNLNLSNLATKFDLFFDGLKKAIKEKGIFGGVRDELMKVLKDPELTKAFKNMSDSMVPEEFKGVLSSLSKGMSEGSVLMTTAALATRNPTIAAAATASVGSNIIENRETGTDIILGWTLFLTSVGVLGKKLSSLVSKAWKYVDGYVGKITGLGSGNLRGLLKLPANFINIPVSILKNWAGVILGWGATIWGSITSIGAAIASGFSLVTAGWAAVFAITMAGVYKLSKMFGEWATGWFYTDFEQPTRHKTEESRQKAEKERDALMESIKSGTPTGQALTTSSPGVSVTEYEGSDLNKMELTHYRGAEAWADLKNKASSTISQLTNLDFAGTFSGLINEIDWLAEEISVKREGIEQDKYLSPSRGTMLDGLTSSLEGYLDTKKEKFGWGMLDPILSDKGRRGGAFTNRPYDYSSKYLPKFKDPLVEIQQNSLSMLSQIVKNTTPVNTKIPTPGFSAFA